jgi:hypothetical protein
MLLLGLSTPCTGVLMVKNLLNMGWEWRPFICAVLCYLSKNVTTFENLTVMIMVMHFHCIVVEEEPEERLGKTHSGVFAKDLPWLMYGFGDADKPIKVCLLKACAFNLWL